jgi:hypothetical protein
LREQIAARSHGFYKFWIARVSLYFLPQAADQNIDAALERSDGSALGNLKQLIAR